MSKNILIVSLFLCGWLFAGMNMLYAGSKTAPPVDDVYFWYEKSSIKETKEKDKQIENTASYSVPTDTVSMPPKQKNITFTNVQDTTVTAIIKR